MQALKPPQAKVEAALNVLAALNLSRIKGRLHAKGDANSLNLEEAEREYKRFIALSAAYATKNTPLAISIPLDPMWHTHILFTREYIDMCNSLGFAFMHHEPATPEELVDLEPSYKRTLDCYRTHFGEPPETFWPPNAQICGLGGCSCSGPGNA